MRCGICRHNPVEYIWQGYGLCSECLDAWRDLEAEGKRAMVEDEVFCFMEWAARKMDSLAADVASETPGADATCLERGDGLSWYIVEYLRAPAKAVAELTGVEGATPQQAARVFR